MGKKSRSGSIYIVTETQPSKELKMNDLNYVLLAGNLVRDPEWKQIDKTSVVCKFTIANNRSYYNKKDESWVNVPCFVTIETWGHVAENCIKHLKKGRGVRIVGRLQQSRWNSPTGTRIESLYVVSEHVEFQPQKKTEQATVVSPEPSEMDKVDSSETQKQLEELPGPEDFQDTDNQDTENQEF